MRLIQRIDELGLLIDQYSKKGVLSNNFMLQEEMSKYILEGRLFSYEYEGNALLFLKKEGFYRLYYYLNEFSKPHELNHKDPVIQEILYRGKGGYPEREINYWSSIGFKKHLGRDCYFLKAGSAEEYLEPKHEIPDFNIETIKTEVDLKRTHQLIRIHLDHYTGDILKYDELQQFSDQDELFGVFYQKRLVGILQAELKNSVFWLGHMVIEEEFRGKKLSSLLLKHYFKKGLEKGCRQFQLWVIDSNVPALNLYKRYGFQYMNKSTISLLKL